MKRLLFMHDLIDDLVCRWKENPSAAMTVALCEALCDSPRVPLVKQVGEVATRHHGGDVTVLLSVARMYIESQRFAEAQSVLVAAGKLATKDPRVYRWLGEVLLRRGDAGRAQKVLERAIQLGARDSGARLWLERARGFRPLQTSAGDRAVAAEVAHAVEVFRAPLDSQGPTVVQDNPRAAPAAVGRTPAPPNGFIRPRVEEPPPWGPQDRHRTTAAEPPPVPSAAAALVKPPAATQAAAQTAAALVKPPHAATQAAVPTAAAFLKPPTATQAAAPAAALVKPPAATQAAVPTAAALVKPPTATQAAVPTAAPVPERIRQSVHALVPGHGSLSRSGSVSPQPPGPPRAGVIVPHTRDVLEALALSGLFEPREANAVGAWDQAAPGPRRKGAPALVVGMVLFLAASVGVFVGYRRVRADAHLRAEGLLATVEGQLQGGRPDLLAEAEKGLTRAFQLESRSPRAALDWTRERATVGLVKSGADVAFEDAMTRAKETGVPDDKYAFARVASFLFQGDTAGAAGVLPRWDGPAAADAWYQLVAGAALERAGDPRARQRYASAMQIDPNLFVAAVGFVRTTAFEGDVGRAMQAARGMRASQPDRAEPLALIALAWGRDPMRELAPVPPEVDELAKREAELPSGLRFVPHAVAALRALDRHSVDEVRQEVQKGLALADSPGAAVWLGTIALPLTDSELARKAALAALQLSAVYEPARALAARVALASGRLDEALKASEELDASSADVAVVRGAAAYEREDSDALGRALDALGPGLRRTPALASLSAARDALAGKLGFEPAKLDAMADDDAPWSDLVAMDIALDGGDLALADKMSASWGKDSESQALRATRLARLARYEGRLDAADTLSLVALDHGTVTPRVLSERAFVLVARNRAAEVSPLLGRYPLVLGPLVTWLSAYANASNGNAEAAKGKTATLDAPPSTAPFAARIVAAAAFAAMKDKKRGIDYTRDLLGTGSQCPDLVAAALQLGLKRVDHGKRRATYE